MDEAEAKKALRNILSRERCLEYSDDTSWKTIIEDVESLLQERSLAMEEAWDALKES